MAKPPLDSQALDSQSAIQKDSLNSQLNESGPTKIRITQAQYDAYIGRAKLEPPSAIAESSGQAHGLQQTLPGINLSLDERIIIGIKAGTAPKRLAAHLGIDRDKIYRVCEKYGVTPKDYRVVKPRHAVNTLIPEENLAKLDALASLWNLNRTAAINRMIEECYAEYNW